MTSAKPKGYITSDKTKGRYTMEEIKTIYQLMAKLPILRDKITLAMKCYNEQKNYYWTFEEEATTVLETAEQMQRLGYTDDFYFDYKEMNDQMWHLIRVNKRKADRR